MPDDRSPLADLLRPGMRVAVADGAGAPLGALADLSTAAAATGDVALLLGWMPAPLGGLDLDAFADIRTIMGGYALRTAIDAGHVAYVPARLGSLPGLLGGPLRVDVLLASVSSGTSGHRFLTESGWARAATDGGAVVAAVERPAVPALDSGPPLPAEQVVVLGSSGEAASEVAWGVPTTEQRQLAERVAALVPEGARIQYGPGPVGTALLDALDVPVAVDTGIVTDAVMHLDRRGLLSGRPLAPYVAGHSDLYEWCRGRVEVDRLERTHDPARLGGAPPLVAVNTALEIDIDGQVNVESAGDSAIAGVGGQPDYAAAAARSRHGLSVIAVPTMRGQHTTLVERLSAPVTTPSHDVEVVATERGIADLRGLSRAERRRAIAALWK
jgi:hypothetical protein